MTKIRGVLLWLPIGALFGASCGSDTASTPDAAGGVGGEPVAHAGEPGAAATGQGGSAALGGSGSMNDAGAAGAAVTNAGAPMGEAGGGHAGSGAEPLGGFGGVGGPLDGAGGAPPLVSEASCVEHEDCLAVCQANGWPEAHCFGSSERFCSCESAGDGPTCTKGTTIGCPSGTACRGPQQCMPYGDATHGDPCDNGDECAPGLICVGFGNPLPNGESTACSTMCEPQSAPAGCDCVAGYCMGGLGLYDFTCNYPGGTPCQQSLGGGVTKQGLIDGPGEISPGYVYTVSAESLANVDLEVCGSPDCQGDNVCVSSGAGGSERCLLQATQASLDVYVINRTGGSTSVAVDVEGDPMFEYKLSNTQSVSSLTADGYHRILVTGLSAQTSYQLSVATTNARDVNMKASNDLHGLQPLCDADLSGAAAICNLTVTQTSIWVVITDTSGIGDGYTFKVTAQ